MHNPLDAPRRSRRALPSDTTPLRLLLIVEGPAAALRLRSQLATTPFLNRRFQFEVATSLKQGLSRLAAETFNVVLLDLHLQESDGFDSIAMVHTEAPDVPIIVLTSTDDDGYAMEALSKGAQDFLVKDTLDGRLLARAICYAIERQHLLDRLAQSSEERFRGIIEHNADGMIVVDLQGIVRYVNPAAEMIFERTEEEIVNRPFYFALSANTSMEVKIPCKGRAAREKLAELRVTAIEWDQRPAYLAAVRDITELKRVEQLKAEISEHERLDRMKDEFVSTASHELRTPLAIIKSAIENLQDGIAGPMTADQQHFLSIGRRNTDRLTKLVNDILDLSRLESGRVPLRRRAVEPYPLVIEILQHCKMIAAERNIAIVEELLPELPAIDVDPDLIAQALTNLLSNAVKFAKQRIVVSATQLESGPAAPRSAAEKPQGRGMRLPARGLKITVRDDGPGIPATSIGRLFNRFEQLHIPGPQSGNQKGTGLGLAITKEIVHLHGGAIWVESPPGGGAHFHCVLPLADPAETTT
ncbi:MAG: PAS domain S-box protein [Deltaproteobacteria bacterium]|nr:PAS domain S-box protein [Deltaproteobacteria bacterium]